ncbi:uncharacterized protein LOC120253315 [Dioscorea cayenensis subsp. rotundata]|uniref:Uncharacterized protein LOC120253315 n=1 Tax=Dioscorea cayennensis subsp. rotundata TaxID=55577 RepID=A0AB40ARL5_DIOCR|nr:uncharacterized protein LOC120253315 [Dioscorea cayenensis subsp. rotundata]
MQFDFLDSSLKILRFVNWGVEEPEARAVQHKLDQITARLSLLLGYTVPQIEIKHVTGITIALRGLGGLVFIYGSSTGAYLLMLYLAFISPMIYDFYNYHIEEPEFFQVFAMFTQNLALFGALLFFIGLNNRMPKRQPKKKGAPRSKKAAPARNHG